MGVAPSDRSKLPGGLLKLLSPVAAGIVYCNLLYYVFITIPVCEFVNTIIHILGFGAYYDNSTNVKHIRFEIFENVRSMQIFEYKHKHYDKLEK